MNRFGIGVRIDGHDVAPWIIEGGSITYGRTTVNEQPGAPTCTLTMFTAQGWAQNPLAWFDYGVGLWGDPSGFVPTHDTDVVYAGPRVPLYIGAPVWVSATTTSGFLPDHDTQDVYMGAEYRRFTGRVQSIEYDWYRVSVVCSGSLEEWARIGIMEPTSVPIDEEQDIDRVLDLAARAGAPTTLHTEGDLGPMLLAPETSDFPMCLLPTLQAIADETDGLLYQGVNGNVTYRTRNWVPPDAWWPPQSIVDAESIAMTLELGDMENAVYVEYGVADIAGIRPQASAGDTESQAQYGVRTGSYTTQLRDGSDAYAHALTLMARSAPAWHMPDVDLRMVLATDADVDAVCTLEQGHQIFIYGLPTGSPVPTYAAQVLGWTEDLTSSDWTVSLHLYPWVPPSNGWVS